MTSNSPLTEDLQRENEFLRQQVRSLQSLATMGELTGTAAHEFNNVLMTIINYAQLGIRNRDDATRDKALSKIHDAAKRAAAITTTILAQARNRSDSMVPTNVVELIESSLVLLGRELQKYRIGVETEFAADTPMAVISGNQIQRVLINLMVNSRQAMPEGGTLLIRTAAAEGGKGIEITVRDSGVGIAKADLQKIFDPYFTTKNGPDETGKGGTGLGLAACKEIIDDHGGRIRVESTLGRGTAFIIRLPAVDANQAAA
jgi:signal transduction histidine kinase